MTKLHVFDMDGTLLPGTSASLELADQLDHRSTVAQYERASAAGAMDNTAFARRCHPLWQTLTDRDVDAAFRTAPWITGIAEVLSDIARRGEFSAVISMSPLFFVQRLLHWGVNTVHATEIPLAGPLETNKVLTTESKVALTRNLLEKHELSTDDCVAYGDAHSDLALFRSLSNTIAVNGTDEIRANARTSYCGTDLRGAYSQARLLLDHHESPRTPRP